MKPIRNILLTAFLSVAVVTALVYTSCNKKNKCHNVVCLNKGVCYDGTCECPAGFEGIRCETRMRDKFLFTYNGYSLCGPKDSIHHYSVYLMAVTHNSNEMVLKHFLDNWDDSAICTIRSTDSFTFIGSNNSLTYTGTGHLSNDSLWMSYHVDKDTTNYDCTYFGQSLR